VAGGDNSCHNNSPERAGCDSRRLSRKCGKEKAIFFMSGQKMGGFPINYMPLTWFGAARAIAPARHPSSFPPLPGPRLTWELAASGASLKPLVNLHGVSEGLIAKDLYIVIITSVLCS
jgi:hypothetical protein